MPTRPTKQLVTFDNPRPGRDYVIRHECPEFTAICPVTGQPDCGTIVVHYVRGLDSALYGVLWLAALLGVMLPDVLRTPWHLPPSGERRWCSGFSLSPSAPSS